ncbi:Phosphoinositide phospholipase C, Ca2+-dependent, variant 3 [Balamuthia mandrillaris]
MALVPSVKKMLALFLLLSTTATTLLCSADHDVAPICDASNDELRLNQIQVVGTHNSYHMRTHREVRDVVDKVIPGIMQLMDYELPPLREQLEDYRVRAFEFDVFYDPSILYARPSGLAVVEEQCDCTLQPPYDQEGVMATSTNSKVFHVQDVDYRTHCYTLVDCLSQLMEWSNSVDGHHTPLFIQLELKANPLPILPSMAEELGFHPVVPLSWANPTALASLEEEILGVIPLDRILSPASLTNDHPNMTLSQVVTEVGWPTISESMGKFIFFLDNNPVSDVQQVFSNTSLPRFIFRERPEGEPDAAIFKRNNPKTHYENIQDLVGKGYIVRARADSGKFCFLFFLCLCLCLFQLSSSFPSFILIYPSSYLNLPSIITLRHDRSQKQRLLHTRGRLVERRPDHQHGLRPTGSYSHSQERVRRSHSEPLHRPVQSNRCR